MNRCTPHSMKLVPPRFHSTNGPRAESFPGRIQASTVRPLLFPTSRTALDGILTASVPPCSAKALPTLPSAKVVPANNIPELTPARSSAFCSPAHQAASPSGTAAQVGGALTVRVATLLVTDPNELLITTE